MRGSRLISPAHGIGRYGIGSIKIALAEGGRTLFKQRGLPFANGASRVGDVDVIDAAKSHSGIRISSTAPKFARIQRSSFAGLIWRVNFRE